MSNADYTPISAAIYGCAGEALTEDERRFFREACPYGFILFARNCRNKAQVKALIAELHEVTGRDWLPILIDQEGGRVARLGPPEWRKSPPAGQFAALAASSAQAAEEATYLNARLMACELAELGITVDCAPMLDIQAPDAHDIIGDRAFGQQAEQVIRLGRAMMRGLQEGGVLPVIKHIPGHGRALVDSHKELPVVDVSLEELQKVDFTPFKALADAPYAMTAHVLYTAIDSSQVATFSPEAIRMIREDIGFQGLLMSDDLSMHALQGDFAERTRRTLDAGCDLILHCNGDMDEMQAIASSTPVLSSTARTKAENIEKHYQAAQPFDEAAALSQRDALLADVRAA